MITTSVILLGLAIMTPIMKCHNFSRSIGTDLNEIYALFKIYPICEIRGLLGKNPKKMDFKIDDISTLQTLFWTIFF
jgi:hypothetical protein